MKLTNTQQTAAVRSYARKHGYSVSTVRTTSELRYAAFADYTASLVEQAQAQQAEQPWQIACPMCNVDQQVVSSHVIARAYDATEVYTLACGHTII